MRPALYENLELRVTATVLDAENPLEPAEVTASVGFDAGRLSKMTDDEILRAIYEMLVGFETHEWLSRIQIK